VDFPERDGHSSDFIKRGGLRRKGEVKKNVLLKIELPRAFKRESRKLGRKAS